MVMAFLVKKYKQGILYLEIINSCHLNFMSLPIIIIGSSAAGLTAFSLLTRQKVPVICITKDIRCFNTCLLSSLLAGKRSDITLPIPQGATIRYGAQVTQIDRSECQIVLSSGERVGYSKLLIATGSKPKRILMHGLYDHPGVFVYHTLDDCLSIQSYIEQHQAKRVLIVGGGINGLECAQALHNLGLSVLVIERDAYLLSRLLDGEIAQKIESLFALQGIMVHLGTTLSAIFTNGQQKKVMLSSGLEYEVDLIITAIGSEPSTSLAKQAGLSVERGISVNEYLQTSDEHIFAAGDCIQFQCKLGDTRVSSLWHDAIAQSVVASNNLTGIKKRYEGFVPTIHTTIFGLPLTISGSVIGADKVTYENKVDGVSAYYWYKERLQGWTLWGHREGILKLKELIG